MAVDFQAWVTREALLRTSDDLWPVGYRKCGTPVEGVVMRTPRIYEAGDTVRVRHLVGEPTHYAITATTPRCYLVFMYGTVWAEEA